MERRHCRAMGADGVDIRATVEAETSGAKEQGLTKAASFMEGDASNLHELKDHTFDLVVSIFGAMFAPKPYDVAKEMVRVTRPEVGSLWATGSKRSDIGRTNPENQRLVLAATAGRLH